MSRTNLENVTRHGRTLLDRIVALVRHPAVLIGAALAIAVIDWVAGPHISPGLLYLIPLGLAAWYGHTRIALAIALALPAMRLSYFAFDIWEPPGTFSHVVVNAVVRAAALGLAALLIHRTRQTRELEREVAALRGMLPICMYCKRIENDAGQWQPVEQYVAERTDASFTHRVCPYCTGTHRAVFLGAR